ncbi:DUF835 domain-containing protein [Thermococcus sp.]
MNVLIGITNFISRWILFFAITFKAIKTKEKGWVLLSFAFFINALDVEHYILNPLGISIKPGAYELASIIPNFLFAILIVWGTIHLKEGTKVKHIVILGMSVVFCYLWIFFASTSIFEEIPFAVRRIPSSWAFGGALIYLGIALRRYVIKRNSLQEMFPLGLVLLGILNLTYPFTRNISWFADIAFLLAAVFRIIAAMGATRFVFYNIEPPKRKEVTMYPGAYFAINEKEVFEKFPRLFLENNVVAITRKSPRFFPFENGILIYWITKVKDGFIDDRQRIFAISPTKIDILIDLVTRALEEGYNLIYMDAFEYIMIENDFKTAFKFLLSLKDRVLSKNKTLIVVVNLEALEKRERKLIEREFERI